MSDNANMPITNYRLFSLLAILILGCGKQPAPPRPNGENVPPARQTVAEVVQKHDLLSVSSGVMLHFIYIPMRENGYNTFDSFIIRSAAELEDFLQNVASQQHWNRKDEFLSAVEDADLDFDSDTLLLIRDTEGSGSVRVWMETPRLIETELVCQIRRTRPMALTMDMAYYCFAIVVPRDLAKTIRIIGSNTSSRYIVDDDGTGQLRRSHSNDIELAVENTLPEAQSTTEPSDEHARELRR